MRVTTAVGELQMNVTQNVFDYRKAETGAVRLRPGSPR